MTMSYRINIFFESGNKCSQMYSFFGESKDPCTTSVMWKSHNSKKCMWFLAQETSNK